MTQRRGQGTPPIASGGTRASEAITSDRLTRVVAAVSVTLGLGTLAAVVAVIVIRAIAPDSDPAPAVAIAAAIGYPLAAGGLFGWERPASTRRVRPAGHDEEGEAPIDVRFVDEVHDHELLLSGFRTVKGRVATHRLRASRGEEPDAFADGYARALRDLAEEIVGAERVPGPGLIDRAANVRDESD